MKKAAKIAKKLYLKQVYKPLLIVFVLTAYLATGWYFLAFRYNPQHTDGFDIVSGQSFTSSRLHTNLDLTVASRANYPSSPLTQVQILGSDQGVEKSIIKFSVKLDAIEEYGLMYLPTGVTDKNQYPVILLLHAYQHPDEYMTTRGYEDDMMFYARHGFAVIKPDFRGQGLSRGHGQPEGANYSMAYNTDVMSLISAVKQTPYLKPSAINVWGHSMGAYIGLRASILSSSIKTAILLAGPVAEFSSTFEAYKAPSDIGNPLAGKIKEEALLKYGTPSANPRFWKNASPINFIYKKKTYYQIHVGAKDLVVPPQFSAELDLRLESLGREHGYYLYPSGDHDLVSERPVIWKRSLQALVE